MNDTSSRNRVRSSQSSSAEDRKAALWKGLPAAILAVLGLAALVFASDRNARLEQRYRRWAEDASKDRVEKASRLINEVRIMRAGEGSAMTLDELIPPTDERRVALDQVSASERLYYQKLISLNGNEPDYRFQFAAACVNSNVLADQQRGYSLMSALAPHNQVGYYKAHLWWAEHFAQLIQYRKINLREGAELVFNHAEFCLRRQTSDKAALRFKGEAAMLLNRNDAALDAYRTLFDSDPLYFGQLVTINNRLNRTSSNVDVYRSAKTRIESKLREDLPVDQWVRYWEALMICMAGLTEFDDAIARLRREIENQIAANNSGNRVFLDDLLSKMLVSKQRNLNPSLNQYTLRDVELMEEAFRLNPKNPDVLLILTRISVNANSEVAEAARKIYDPTADPNPIALVVNELGTAALARKDYTTALKYLERARELSPQNIDSLNNLAYVYLVAENRNPERALKLVDDAIRLVPDPDVAKTVMTFFLHTKGTALMQLNRMPEAIAAFELALQDRPENVEIIRYLIQCYEASNLSADAYKEQLKKLTGSEQ
jgi:tetratricopeptide (TPR) repeat protein